MGGMDIGIGFVCHGIRKGRFEMCSVFVLKDFWGGKVIATTSLRWSQL